MQAYKIDYTQARNPEEAAIEDAYRTLQEVLDEAYHQAAIGKGKERHAIPGEAFEDQQICEITRRLGVGYPLGQAVKKIYEAERMYQEAAEGSDGERRAVAELLGAIVYVAGAIIVFRENENGPGKSEKLSG